MGALYATSMNSIKVMTDYHSFPIWHHESDMVGDIDPEDLPITKELVLSLLEWAATYDATSMKQDPMEWGFATETCKTEFIEKGLELAKKLKCELKTTEVYYYHEGIGRVIRI